ncbi:MAG TPA: hypothetical protein VGS96_16690, partial [Thermoanaerobaculia bacterium]|nr:hypothetical protein [Thermoanaerobaculia bacterium]
MTGLASYAEIAVPVAVHGTFTYTIPDPLRDAVRLGSRVEVEIGSKLTTGFVVGFNDSSETTKLKPVRSVLDEDEPPLLPDIIQLCRWAAEYYLAPLGEMLRVALPANMGARGRREAALVASPEMIDAALDARQVLEPDLEIISELRKRPLLLREMDISRTAIERLRDAGVIVVRDRLQDAKGVRYDRFALLEAEPGLLTEKQQAVVERLRKR